MQWKGMRGRLGMQLRFCQRCRVQRRVEKSEGGGRGRVWGGGSDRHQEAMLKEMR